MTATHPAVPVDRRPSANDARRPSAGDPRHLRPARAAGARRLAALPLATVIAALAAALLPAPSSASASSTRSNAKATAATEVSGPAIPTPLGGKNTKVQVTIKAVGGRTLTNLTVSASTPAGVVASFSKGKRSSKTVKVLKLRSGKSTTVTLGARTTGKGPARGQLTVRVKQRSTTLGTALIGFGGAPSTPANPNSLAGRSFWGSLYGLSGTSQDSLLFVSDGFVFAGDASTEAWQDGAVSPTCAAATEDCKPYTYDAKTNALTIDGKPAELKPRAVTWDGRTYGEYGAPPAGSRFDTVVTYANSSGLCPLYCTYYREDLTFLPDGTFIRGSVVSGTSPTVDFASVPADRKGTYEIRPDRTILLAFADGSQRTRTIALGVKEDGSLAPAGDGMILGGEGYFDIRD